MRTKPKTYPFTNLVMAGFIAASIAGFSCTSSSTTRRSQPVGQVEAASSNTTSASTARIERRSDSQSADQPQPVAIRQALESMGPEALEFHDHVISLSNPFFEGRSADTRGNAIAAEYVAFYFNRAGLEPAFDDEMKQSDAALETLASAWEQDFTVPGDLEVKLAQASVTQDGQTLELVVEEDFNPLGFSENGEVTGPLAFVGYSIEGGQDDYTSYAEGDDLTGKIAVIFRFEPMNIDGSSKWSRFSRWSNAASLLDKVEHAAKRKAAGVILVNPPGADDPRSERLETPSSSRFGRTFDIPAIMITTDVADELIRKADPQGRSLMDLRRIADETPKHGIIDLSSANTQVTMRTELERTELATKNVGAILRGKGSLSSEWVIIGGHYDHVGYGYVGGASPANQGKLHPGADDNASGTAGVIMLAERFAEQYAQLPENAQARSILFLAFSAEEMGLLGSEHYIKHANITASQIVAMLNLDMIGRVEDGEVEVAGVGTAENFMDLLKPHFEASSLKIQTADSGVGPSDHATFHRAGMPVLHFFSGTHEDYHRPTDFGWKVNYIDGAKVVDLIYNIAYDLATRADKLTFKETGGQQAARQRTRAKVRLGIAPATYATDDPGVPVGDVFPNTSAGNAGMKPGDRIVKWGGEELADVQAMMERLMTHNPGDVVEIVVIRDGQPVTLTVTLIGQEPQG